MLLKLTLQHMNFYQMLYSFPDQHHNACLYKLPQFDNIIRIFGGYEAHTYTSTISTKPNLSSTLFAFHVGEMVYVSKMSKPEHAIAGHSMFLLDNSTLLIYGGDKKRNSLIYQVGTSN